MKGAGAFHRANAMMAAISGILAATVGNFAAQKAQLAALGSYESRGKGGKAPHRKGNGSARVKRAACKARNVARNRRAHRA